MQFQFNLLGYFIHTVIQKLFLLFSMEITVNHSNITLLVNLITRFDKLFVNWSVISCDAIARTILDYFLLTSRVSQNVQLTPLTSWKQYRLKLISLANSKRTKHRITCIERRDQIHSHWPLTTDRCRYGLRAQLSNPACTHDWSTWSSLKFWLTYANRRVEK